MIDELKSLRAIVLTINQMDGPFFCTQAVPWSPVMNLGNRQIIHLDAVEVGDQEDGWPAGDIVTMQCPYCKHRWKKELPQ